VPIGCVLPAIQPEGVLITFVKKEQLFLWYVDAKLAKAKDTAVRIGVWAQARNRAMLPSLLEYYCLFSRYFSWGL